MVKTKEIMVVYDGQCPFCTSYCQLVKIKKAVGNLKLVDARQPSAIMDEITSLGLDIDRGMVVKMDNQIYYGSEAIHLLSLLSTRSDLFNRITYWLFKSKIISTALYPLLRNCRNLALWLMGIPMINNLSQEKKT